MAKNKTMEDMVPRKKKARETTDVPVRKIAPLVQPRSERNGGEEFFKKRPETQSKKPDIKRWYTENGSRQTTLRRPKWKYIAILLVFTAVSVFIGGMMLFGKVIVQIIPRTESIVVDTEFNAGRQINSEIGLETLRFESELEKNSQVTGSQKVEKSASGRIIIYNAFSKEPQVLVRRTRFETPEGKIYRLSVNTTVPGSSTEGEKVKPGSIEVEITADAPGESYNIGLTDFTIPGFKGSPRYDKFYARSKTPMTGGFSGISPTVTKDDVAKLEESVKNELSEKFLAQVRQELPPGFVIPEKGKILTVENINRSHEIGDPTSTLSIAIKSSFIAFAIKLEDVEKKIIDKYVEDKNNADIKIVNIESLSYIAKTPDFEKQKLVFVVNGEALAVWRYSETKLKSELISAPRNSRLEVFSSYPEIARAQIKFSPSWWRFFPKDPKKIHISEEGYK